MPEYYNVRLLYCVSGRARIIPNCLALGNIASSRYPFHNIIFEEIMNDQKLFGNFGMKQNIHLKQCINAENIRN